METGLWWAAFIFAPIVAGIAVAVFVFKRQPLIIDGRLIDKAKRDTFDRISEAHCGDRGRYDLQNDFCEMAIDCITAAYLVFNPETTIPPQRLRKRFNASCTIIGNSAIMDLYFGKKLEGPEQDALNIPIDREVRLKRPAEVPPNGNGIKTKPAPRPTPKAPAQTQKTPPGKGGVSR